MDDIPTSVRAMRAGAIDYLTKPVNTPAFLSAVARACDLDLAARRTHDKIASGQRPSCNAYPSRTSSVCLRCGRPAKQANCRRARHRGKSDQGPSRPDDAQDGSSHGAGSRTYGVAHRCDRAYGVGSTESLALTGERDGRLGCQRQRPLCRNVPSAIYWRLNFGERSTDGPTEKPIEDVARFTYRTSR
jgi:hypothetical protein